MTSLLLLGSTGYVGGTVLVALRKAFPDWHIKALVRNPTRNEAILTAGASEVVNASNQDLDKVEALSEASDIVVNATDADDLPVIEAILRGFKSRFQAGKGLPILVHTTGTGIFLDGALDGAFNPAGHVYTDETEDDIRAITVDRFHGHVDVPILAAGEEGYVRTYMIAPGAITGRGLGPVGKAGLLEFFGPLTQQMKGPWYIGEGTGVFPAVHVEDLSDLYIILLKKALADKALAQPPESSFSRYYIAGVNDITWKDVIMAFSEVLLEKGFIDNLDQKSITAQEAGPWGTYLSSNCRVRPWRAATLGWKPRTVTMSSFAELAEESIKNMKK